ncbi:MAG: NAD(P)/FAD-dependent oxidoreductase [Planctomycetota bacterium]|nr:NAD(P)/FAD-dependent oxidoreductase [Planctomycetota bacterium]
MAERRVVIIGAGPAGLTAAYEFAKHGWKATVLEADAQVGGLARTVQYRGFRFDLGGHRFFSKSQEIEDLWQEILGPEMIERPRLSRIYYRNRFFYYPLKPMNALINMGLFNASACMASYAMARLKPIAQETNFEEWVTNRFGRRLYQMFFKTYTEKVWGIPCTEIGADWAAQRIKGLDLLTAVKNAFFGQKKGGAVVKTLIDSFRYPRLGPGQMWEACRDRVREKGTAVVHGMNVTGLRAEGGRIVAVQAAREDGGREEFPCDYCISSMPLRDLVLGLAPGAPEEVRKDAANLRYRDFLTVALIVEREDLFPDNWIYVHSPEVKVGRIQNFKQWSPDLVPDPKRSCLGLEYFVWENDELWKSSDADLVAMGTREVARLKLVKEQDVSDGAVTRVKKAYPIYDTGYQDRLDRIKAYVKTFANLHCIGRNGQHRYNNQDHSMATALLAVRNIAQGAAYDPWNVNVDAEYHEIAQTERQAPTYPKQA